MTDEPIAVCRNVSCGYTEHPVLEQIDLQVHAGEIIAVLGRSGSGKSTLLRSLAGLLPPIAGTVELFGHDLYALDPSARHRLMHRIGVLFQSDALFGSRTILDNVMLPLTELTDLPRPLARELALSKLALVGVAQLADRMPSAVSGGQRKRAALARAMVLDPEILFCDEPTSGLDPVTGSKLDKTLLELRDAANMAIVAVTHDVASVRSIADRALLVAQGGVEVAGTIQELERSKDPDVYFFFHRGEPEGSAEESRAR